MTAQSISAAGHSVSRHKTQYKVMAGVRQLSIMI